MQNLLHDGVRWLEVTRWRGEKRSKVREFGSQYATESYLRSIAQKGMNLRMMRRILDEAGEGLDISRLTDEQVIALLAVRLAQGRLHLIESVSRGASFESVAPGMSRGAVLPAVPMPPPRQVEVPAGGDFEIPVPRPRPKAPVSDGLTRVSWRKELGAEAEAVLEAVIRRTQDTAEALGEMGLEVAKRRLKIRDDPRFISRYHGNDGIGQDEQGRLVGMEAKGTNDDSTSLAKRSNGSLQLSAEANRQTAQKMINKKKHKVGLPSKRQGGSYTQEEMELYTQIDDSEGEKRLVSSHTNTETGRVRVFERNSQGGIDDPKKPIREFMLEDVDTLKKMLVEKRRR